MCIRDRGVFGSWFHCINHTKTAGGARLLTQHMLKPWGQQQDVQQQLDRVEFWVNNSVLATDTHNTVKEVADLERVLTRIAMQRFTPRDVGSVRVFLHVVERLSSMSQEWTAELFKECQKTFGLLPWDLFTLLRNALVAELPVALGEDLVIAPGYNADLDEMRNQDEFVRNKMQCLEKDYIQQTGISGLRIKENKATGLFVEVNKNAKHLSLIHI